MRLLSQVTANSSSPGFKIIQNILRKKLLNSDKNLALSCSDKLAATKSAWWKKYFQNEKKRRNI